MLTWKMALELTVGSTLAMARIARSDDKAGDVCTRNSLLIKGLWVCGEHP